MTQRGQDALDAVCLALLPAALITCALLRLPASALLTLLAAAVALGVFFAGWEASKPPLRQVLPAAVLSALGVAGRILFAALPNIQPVTAICVIAGAAFGRRTGFMVGATCGLASSFFLGLGPWTPWQMYAWGLVGFLAGALFCRRAACGPRQPRKAPWAVLAFGFCASFAFGFIMNAWTLVGFTAEVTWASALAVFGAGLAFDAAHAASTVAFLALLYVPWMRRLERIERKYALAGRP